MAGRREKFKLIRMAWKQRAEGRAMDRVGSMGGAPGGWTCPRGGGGASVNAESLAARLSTAPDAPGPPAGKRPACGGSA